MGNTCWLCSCAPLCACRTYLVCVCVCAHMRKSTFNNVKFRVSPSVVLLHHMAPNYNLTMERSKILCLISEQIYSYFSFFPLLPLLHLFSCLYSLLLFLLSFIVFPSLFPPPALLHPPRVTSRLTCGWVKDLGLAVAAGNSQTLGDSRLHKTGFNKTTKQKNK